VVGRATHHSAAQDQAGDGEGGLDEDPGLLRWLKATAGNVSLKTMLDEIAKLEAIHSFALPAGAVAGRGGDGGRLVGDPALIESPASDVRGRPGLSTLAQRLPRLLPARRWPGPARPRGPTGSVWPLRRMEPRLAVGHRPDRRDQGGAQSVERAARLSTGCRPVTIRAHTPPRCQRRNRCTPPARTRDTPARPAVHDQRVAHAQNWCTPPVTHRADGQPHQSVPPLGTDSVDQ